MSSINEVKIQSGTPAMKLSDAYDIALKELGKIFPKNIKHVPVEQKEKIINSEILTSTVATVNLTVGKPIEEAAVDVCIWALSIYLYTSGQPEGSKNYLFNDIRASQIKPQTLPYYGILATNIERFIYYSPKPPEQTLYHGVEDDEEHVGMLQTSKIYPLIMLSSYTLTLWQAARYAALGKSKSLFVVEPGGVGGAYVNDFSQNDSEEEVLLSGANVLSLKSFKMVAFDPSKDLGEDFLKYDEIHEIPQDNNYLKIFTFTASAIDEKRLIELAKLDQK